MKTQNTKKKKKKLRSECVIMMSVLNVIDHCCRGENKNRKHDGGQLKKRDAL